MKNKISHNSQEFIKVKLEYLKIKSELQNFDLWPCFVEPVCLANFEAMAECSALLTVLMTLNGLLTPFKPWLTTGFCRKTPNGEGTTFDLEIKKAYNIYAHIKAYRGVIELTIGKV